MGLTISFLTPCIVSLYHGPAHSFHSRITQMAQLNRPKRCGTRRPGQVSRHGDASDDLVVEEMAEIDQALSQTVEGITGNALITNKQNNMRLFVWS
jgi:hypothetical protein